MVNKQTNKQPLLMITILHPLKCIFTVLSLGNIPVQKDPIAMKDAPAYAGPLSPSIVNIINQLPRERHLYDSSCEDREMTAQSAPRHIIF